MNTVRFALIGILLSITLVAVVFLAEYLYANSCLHGCGSLTAPIPGGTINVNYPVMHGQPTLVQITGYESCAGCGGGPFGGIRPIPGAKATLLVDGAIAEATILQMTGSNSTGQVTHVFSAPGAYTLGLKIEDKDGNASYPGITTVHAE